MSNTKIQKFIKKTLHTYLPSSLKVYVYKHNITLFLWANFNKLIISVKKVLDVIIRCIIAICYLLCFCYLFFDKNKNNNGQVSVIQFENTVTIDLTFVTQSIIIIVKEKEMENMRQEDHPRWT